MDHVRRHADPRPGQLIGSASSLVGGGPRQRVYVDPMTSPAQCLRELGGLCVLPLGNDVDREGFSGTLDVSTSCLVAPRATRRGTCSP